MLHSSELKAMDGKEVEKALATLSPEELNQLQYNWEFWARPNQLAPEGAWKVWLLNCGRGFGKTRTGTEWVRSEIKKGRMRMAAVGPTKGSVRQVMIDGESGLLSVCHASDKTDDGVHLGKPVWSPTNNTVTWANGAKVEVFSAEDPERLRGPQFEAAWCDEICLISDSYVSTINGPKTIDKITKDDMILTRFGYKPVVEAWKTGERQTWKIETESGKTLQGTFDHPVMTPDGWKSLGKLKVGESILALNGMEDAGTKHSATTSTEKVTCCTEKSMNPIMGLLKRVSTYITSMKTKVTIGWKILKHFLSQIMSNNILLEDSTKTLTQGSGQGHSGIVKNLSSYLAHSVAHVLNQLAQEQSFAQTCVVSDTVVKVEKADRQDVYNITVKDCHEYFANGILNHNCAWTRRDETWDMLQFCMRLGKNPQIVVTTTPKPDKLIRRLTSSEMIDSGKVVITQGTSYDNADNIDLDALKQYEGTRLGRQELYAEILTEAAGALWNKEMLEQCQAHWIEDPVEFSKSLLRIVVAIDPAVTANKHSDLTGIMVAGIDVNGKAYVLEDATGTFTPEGWASKAIELYEKYSADRIVAERNQGGDMVRHTLKTVDETIPITLVHASRGKYARAEPVSALYEQGKVFHVKGLMDLEDQMVTWEPLESIGSPDRLDAMVWAITNLLLNNRIQPPLKLIYKPANGFLN